MNKPPIDTLTWCRRILLKENTQVDKAKADVALHYIMNYQKHTPLY